MVRMWSPILAGVLLWNGAAALSLDGRRSKSSRVAPISAAGTVVDPDRRDFLRRSSVLLGTAANGLLMPAGKSFAIGEGSERMVFSQKPTAPVGALLPAIQQRLLLEAAVELSSEKEDNDDTESIDKLKSILLQLDDDTNVGNKIQQDFKVMKNYNPAKVLRGDLTRATMNLYQTNLNYNNLLANPNEAFTITDPEWKKSYIRANDGLPDLKRLIGADIDMRQLLRNQVQSKLDDAAAELYAPDRDPDELHTLLVEASQSFDLWLDRVRAGDVQDALRAVFKGESVQVSEPFAAGFLPPR